MRRIVSIAMLIALACTGRTSAPLPAGAPGDATAGDRSGDSFPGDSSCSPPAVAISEPNGGSDFATINVTGVSWSGTCDIGAQLSVNLGSFADAECADGSWALQPLSLGSGATRIEVTATMGACRASAAQTVIGLSPEDRFRSVGDVGALAGTGVAEISGFQVTFEAPLPARVGVGDFMQYDVDAGAAGPEGLAFVHARISDTRLAVAGPGFTEPLPSVTASWSLHRAYSSLADAIAGNESAQLHANLADFDPWTVNDLTASGEVWNIACYADRVDTVPVDIPTWTTSPDHYLRIFTPVAPHQVGVSQRHAGVWGSGYALQVQNDDGIFIETDHVRIEGLQIWVSAVNGGNQKALEFSALGTDCDFRVSHSILRGAGVVGPSWHSGFVVYQAGAGVARVSNTIAYDFDRDSGDVNNSNVGFECYDPDFVCHVHNNTAYRNRFGIGQWNGAPAHAKNNLSYNNAENFFGVFEADSSNNLAGPAGVAPGSSPQSDATVVFRDQAGADFHLGLSDVAARGNGIDLNSDPALPCTDDIDGEPRPEGAGWDIGADQIIE